MLKNIPEILSPELLKILAEMGHGDEIVIADGNFPAAAIAGETVSKNLVRLDGHGATKVLEAVLKVFPLDPYVEKAVRLMEVMPGDPVETPIWEDYRAVLEKSNEPFEDFEMVERFAFYQEAKGAYAIIATGESALYANMILKKGIVV